MNFINKRAKRIPRSLISVLLALALTLSIVPVAFAARDKAAVPGISASAGFTADVTLSENASSYDANLSIDLDGLDVFTGYELVVDWGSLADYVGKVRYSANDEVRDANGSPKNYGAHDQLGTLKSYQRYLQIYGADTISDLTGVAIVKFTLNNSLPAGKYPVKVTVIDVIDGDAKPILTREDPSTYLHTTGVLTVRNADGTLPDEPAEDTVYQISSSVESLSSGSVSCSKTEAKAGETISVTLKPATGYELGRITATDTTNSAPVDLTKVSDTEYTFTMPDGNVQVNISYKLSKPSINGYAIKIGTNGNGSIHTNGVESAEAGETVTVFVKPNKDYEIVSVAVSAETGVNVTVSGGTKQDNGYSKYTFTMPKSDITVNAVFRLIDESNRDEVTAGHILTKGTVLTSNNAPLAGAKVQLVYETGGSKGQVAAETISGSDGSFTLPEVSGSYTYKLQASYDTGIQKGKPANPGYIVYSAVKSVSMSSDNVDNKGEVSVQTLTISLYYEWDVDNDGTIERVYAGKDDKFLTSYDFYQKTVGGQTVNVYADETGKIQSEKAYYLWEVNTDGVKEKVYVGGGYKAGTDNDYYMIDVDHDPKTADIEVTIGTDCIPATSDDTYTLDVNNDGKREVVSAGTDGLIATEDDWYVYEGETIYAGSDKIAGTSNDWFLGDGDGHDKAETIYLGKDRMQHTEDDNYKRDVDGNGKDETIYAGNDKQFNTSDDYYVGKVGGTDVNVYPGTGDGEDKYEFGRTDDHYGWTVGGEDVIVRVGSDKTAGTSDDEFDWSVKDNEGNDVSVIVKSGPDGVPGTFDDYYMYDADKDGKDEKVVVGTDNIAGTKDDHYAKDVNKDGKEETVTAGEDAMFSTPDDHYNAEVNTPDGGKETSPVYAGEDGKFSDPKDPGSDDWYPWDTNKDGKVEPDIYGSDSTDKVFIDGDSIASTDDDYHLADPDKDGKTDKIFVGPDRVPGTSDDHYLKDVDGDGTVEDVKAGEDGKFGTADDHYLKDVDGDGVEEDVKAGEDGKFGTSDDHYLKDVDGDGVEEDVKAGEDGKFGTSDDHYLKDVDGDGTEEDVKAGEDGKFGTSDDHYLKDVDGDGVEEDVKAGEDGKFGTSDDHYLKDVDGDGVEEDIKAGEDGKFGTSDDHYLKDVDGDGVEEDIKAGEDGKFGTADDHYSKDVDGDGVEDDVKAGEDGKFGTSDDHYLKDVDGDGTEEDIKAGEDGKFGTSDDHYLKDVDGDGVEEDIKAGEDGKFGTSDDHYLKDVDGDGVNEDIKAGEDGKFGTSDDHYSKDVDGDGVEEDIKAGEDGKFGTADDHYSKDVDGDGVNEDIKAGEDGKFGTGDDHYSKDVDGDGVNEDIKAGEDGKFGTADDYYNKDIDGDGTAEDIKAGSDGKFGTADDHYSKDIDGDGVEDKLRAGADGKLGTPDDEYDKDIDKDGKVEVVYVGADTKPNTEDDWYYPDITFDAGNGSVNGSSTYTVIASAIKSLPTASRSGYSFNGWSKTQNGSALTLKQVLALRADTTLHASFSYNTPSYGGGGGGGGGGTTIVVSKGSLTVTFDTAGGSAIEAQTVASGKKAVKPADPTRYGFTFTGWYSDEARTEAFDFDTKIKENMTLYAGWKLANNSAVFKYLTRDHIAYINGFDDGLVRASESMTRAQAAQVFFNLLNGEAKAHYKTARNDFSDVASDSWYNEAVSTLANMGILNGYGDGRFGPDDTMTRAQFAAICVRIAGLKPSGSSKFSDVAKDHWAYSSICAAADAGWINGYGDGRFGPDDQITRAQVVTLLNRVLHRNAKAGSFDGLKNNTGFRTWPDNADSSAWYYYDMIEAGNSHSCNYNAAGTEIWTGLKAAK